MRIRGSKADQQVHQEVQLVVGMVVSSEFLRRIAPLVDLQLFQHRYLRLVAEWCISFAAMYDRAPERDLETIYLNQVQEGRLDEVDADLIEQMLTGLSGRLEAGEFDTFNVEYMLDLAERYLQVRSITVYTERLKADLISDDLSAAEHTIATYKMVRRSEISYVNPFTDKEAIRAAFEEAEHPLFTYPDAAGDLLSEFMVRDGFFAFMGPEKRGKTWWLMDLAFRANSCRLNVAFFAVGDMSQKQMIRRLHTYLAQRSYLDKYCGEIRVPMLDCARNQENVCRMAARKCHIGIIDDSGGLLSIEDAIEAGYEPCTACRHRRNTPFKPAVWYGIRPRVSPLTWIEGVQFGERWASGRAGGHEIRMSVHPNTSINIAGISNILDMWEGESGWIPDVVVVDYMDILSPEPGDERDTNRDKQDGNWRAARRLSQVRHCLFASATQADAASYEAGLLRMKNFSEDKRKYGHATAVVGLNQISEEKEAGLMRLNVICAREAEYDERHTITALQSLQQGRPCLDSFHTNPAHNTGGQEDVETDGHEEV